MIAWSELARHGIFSRPGTRELFLALAVPAALLAALATAVLAVRHRPPVVTDRLLVASEDFDGAALDPTRWGTYSSRSTNRISTWRSGQVSVGGGLLRIAGRGRDPSGRVNVSGGLCWCRGAQAHRRYGTWRIRARFDPGAGFGQAILLWPRSGEWPDDGEIDIVETPAAAKNWMVGTVHWGAGRDHRQGSGRLTGDFTRWHVYTVDWRAGWIRILVDDRLVLDSRTMANRPRLPTAEMHLAIQQEPGPMGTNWVPPPDAGTPAEVGLYVDWVKVYR